MLDVLELLERLQLDENIRLSTVRVFLFITMGPPEGVPISDIAKALNLAPPAAQRAVQRLMKGSTTSHSVGEGLDLVERRSDPRQPKRFLYHLNEAGKHVAASVL